MVRETSQWEREEMEKVVSQTENSLLVWAAGKIGSIQQIEIQQEKSIQVLLCYSQTGALEAEAQVCVLSGE